MLTAEELTERRATDRGLAGPDRLAPATGRAGRTGARSACRSFPSTKALLTADGGVLPRRWDPARVQSVEPVGAPLLRLRTAVHRRPARPGLGPLPAPVAVRACRSSGHRGGDRRIGRCRGQRANQILQGYRDYLDYPNRDNVLGPGRLFFSTYLESIWIGNYLAAATLLREGGLLESESAEVVSTVADEAANLIGEYDEGLSNRQTWHNAALASIAVWFEDGELASRCLEGQTGILAHLIQGFGEDGMWYEGDNYHFFALRGQAPGDGMGPPSGGRSFDDARLAHRLAQGATSSSGDGAT